MPSFPLYSPLRSASLKTECISQSNKQYRSKHSVPCAALFRLRYSRVSRKEIPVERVERRPRSHRCRASTYQGNSASDHANALISDRQSRLLRHQGGIVVGLGDPIVDALVFAEDEQLCELGYETGGCIPVDSYDDIEELLATFPEETRTPGGSAANVIRGLAGFNQVGFKCAFIGKVGTDAAGAQYACGLEERGITSLLHQSDTSTPTGICISLVSPDGQRTMRPYL
ncbi:hypothetical protein CYMTET_31330, partial [Cymbomonas tetramitiformis]